MRFDLSFIEPPVIIDSPAATACVIWLHGLGADGHDFSPVVPMLGLSEHGVRWISPHAPRRPVTLNGGQPMRAWYDIYVDTGGDLSFNAKEDEQGFATSAQIVDYFIQQQIRAQIPSHKIVLAGFSQGGALALYTGLRYPQPLAGVVALSCYLPFEATARQTQNSANAETPLFCAHGRNDTVIPYGLGHLAYHHLNTWREKVQWRDYAMGHSVCDAEIHDIKDWLGQILAIK